MRHTSPPLIHYTNKYYIFLPTPETFSTNTVIQRLFSKIHLSYKPVKINNDKLERCTSVIPFNSMTLNHFNHLFDL